MLADQSAISIANSETGHRIVKRAISKYNARGPNINRTSYKATLSIDILTHQPP